LQAADHGSYGHNVNLLSHGRYGFVIGHAVTRARHRAAVATLGLAVAATALFAAPSAWATTHHPTGELAPFADCPLSNPNTTVCNVGKTEGGEITIGSQKVPITNPILIQGGVHIEGSTDQFIGAEDGNTLSKSPQKVPGGLLDFVKCNEISNFIERIACELVFENGTTGVTATTELAAPASSIGISFDNLFFGIGTGLSLPVKVHLENPLFGSQCYVGSNANPIVLALTTGTTSPPPPNKPIKGSPGTQEQTEHVLTISNSVLVNNSFSAPAAEGCGGIFSFLIDPIIDAKLGLPSAAGHNTAILDNTFKIAFAEEVIESE
jgi:hypothetical protein